MSEILVKLLFNKVNAIFCAAVIGGVTGQLIWDSAYPLPMRVFLILFVCWSVGSTVPTVFKIPKWLEIKELKEPK